MRGFEALNADTELSVAMPAAVDVALQAHLNKGAFQEDLTFAYWYPSIGFSRATAVVSEMVTPRPGDRMLHGNVAFTRSYLHRVLKNRPARAGIALIHNHLTNGWQDMSQDDVVAERDRLAGPVFGQSQLPLLGITMAKDGAWSARFWEHKARNQFTRRDADTVRVVGKALRISFHPDVKASPLANSAFGTASVWSDDVQDDLSRTRVGIIGLGSVGSLMAESLARSGFSRITLIDFDTVENKNLGRTAGATAADVLAEMSKVKVAARNIARTSTRVPDIRSVESSLLDPAGLRAALDCDAIISCVDRPMPRFMLNALAYSHLIPVVDGGILARVNDEGSPLSIDWRVHTVGPERGCLICIGALRMSDVALDRDGQFDDADYIKGLDSATKAMLRGRNVFAFSMSVAAHETLQLIGLLSGSPRIGGIGAQSYHCYPGTMSAEETTCGPDCEFSKLIAQASDLSPNLTRARVGPRIKAETDLHHDAT